MPSSHHSGNQNMKGERKAIKKCRGDYNKKKCWSQDHKYHFKNAEVGSGRNPKSDCEARLQKTRQNKKFRDNRRDFTNDNFPSPPTVRSPWASPLRPRPRSLWFRSPVRLGRQAFHESEISQSSPEMNENIKSDSSNKDIGHYDSDNESEYVYEKIEGWDTDTDDEETPTTK